MAMKCWLAAFFGLQFINPVLLDSHTAVLSTKYMYLLSVCRYFSYIYVSIFYTFLSELIIAHTINEPLINKNWKWKAGIVCYEIMD